MAVEPLRRRVIVRGRVQGVFFRASTRDRALALGLAGWVRNLADGSVEAVFEGAANAVAAGVDFCRTGPEYARVDALEEIVEPVAGEVGFTVR